MLCDFAQAVVWPDGMTQGAAAIPVKAWVINCLRSIVFSIRFKAGDVFQGRVAECNARLSGYRSLPTAIRYCRVLNNIV